MKKIITAFGKFGPYKSIEILADRYRVDGPSDLPFTIIGQGEISDVVNGDFPPIAYVASQVELASNTSKEELMTQLQELQLKIQSLT